MWLRYFDFRKAFDAVDNDIPLSKFAAIRFDGLYFRCYRFFLRATLVIVNSRYMDCVGCLLEPYHKYSGVSQGSNLGPLIFMINDLPDVVCVSKCLLFADVSNLFLKIEK